MAAAFVPGAVVAEGRATLRGVDQHDLQMAARGSGLPLRGTLRTGCRLPEPVCVSRAPMGPSIVIDLAGGTRLTIDAQASVGLVGAVLRALR